MFNHILISVRCLRRGARDDAALWRRDVASYTQCDALYVTSPGACVYTAARLYRKYTYCVAVLATKLRRLIENNWSTACSLTAAIARWSAWMGSAFLKPCMLIVKLLPIINVNDLKNGHFVLQN